MSRTLSLAAAQPSVRRWRAAPVLVVIADTPGQEVPAWAVESSAAAGWELRRHPGVGPAAAAAAARLDGRVLLLRPPASPAPRPRVVAAVRRLPDDTPVVADAAACAARMGARLTLVHAVPRSFGERSVGLAGAVAHGRRLLDVAAARLVHTTAGRPVDPAGRAGVSGGPVVDVELLRMRPYELVGEALDADLLVVGGRRADGRVPAQPLGAGPGLVASSALHHAPCPVLLTPR